MKYKLPRPVFTPILRRIISRELRKQKFTFLKACKQTLKELALVSKAIESKGLPHYLICKKLPHHLGRGIFLHPNADPILKGHAIASYSGEVSLIRQSEPDDGSYAFTPLMEIHLTREEQSLFDKAGPYRSQRLYALKIDAMKGGNLTRFINHSEKPNVRADIISIPRNAYGLTPAAVEIVYTAKRTIHPGEQLLVSYEAGGKSYWRALNIKPFPMTAKTLHLNKALKIIEK